MLKQMLLQISAWRAIAFCLIIAVFLSSLSLLPPIQPKAQNSSPKPRQANTVSYAHHDTPNVVTNSFLDGATKISKTTDTTLNALANGLDTALVSTYKGIRQIGKTSANALSVALKKTSSTLAYIGSRTISSGLFVLRTPGNIINAFGEISAVQAFISPASTISAPLIEPFSPEKAFASSIEINDENNQITKEDQQPSNQSALPIQGSVTAAFGVPHYPYQPRHTGIDIRSGRPSGVTAVKPFRSGTVQEVIYSRYGFGNHVIVSHGNGLTSLYGHLSSISIKKGQKVTTSSILGREGTTGLSTGTHLHFELRSYGKVIDPSSYVNQ